MIVVRPDILLDAVQRFFRAVGEADAITQLVLIVAGTMGAGGDDGDVLSQVMILGWTPRYAYIQLPDEGHGVAPTGEPTI